MRKRGILQASRSGRACERGRALRRGRGRCFTSILEGVIIAFSCSCQTPCGGEENGSGGLYISRGRGAGRPYIEEHTAQSVFIVPGKGGLNLHCRS